MTRSALLFFKYVFLFEGSDEYATLVFSQSEGIEGDKVYTWNVRHNEGIHTIVLLDYSGSGSSSVTLTGSGVDLSLQFSTSRVERSFNVVMPLSNLHNHSDWIVGRTGELFSVTPTYDGSVNTFSISSGSLPAGLSINESTGVISGTPSATVTNHAVTIKGTNPLGSAYCNLTFTVFVNPTACESNSLNS